MDTLTLFDATRFQPARFLKRAQDTAHAAGCALSVRLDEDHLVLTLGGDPALATEIGGWILDAWARWRREATSRMAR